MDTLDFLSRIDDIVGAVKRSMRMCLTEDLVGARTHDVAVEFARARANTDGDWLVSNGFSTVRFSTQVDAQVYAAFANASHPRDRYYRVVYAKLDSKH